MHVAVDDFYDEIKTCSQHRVIGNVQKWKILFVLLEESVFSGFSLLFFRGNQSIQFFFLFISFFSPEKVLTFCTHLYSQKNKDFFFALNTYLFG